MKEIFQQFLQDYVNLSYDELVARAKALLPDVYVELSLLAKDGDGTNFLFTLVGLGIVADSRLSDLEYLFLCDTLGLEDTYEQAKRRFTPYATEDYSKTLLHILSSLSEDALTKVAHFVTCFMAADERLPVEESAYLQILYSY